MCCSWKKKADNKLQCDMKRFTDGKWRMKIFGVSFVVHFSQNYKGQEKQNKTLNHQHRRCDICQRQHEKKIVTRNEFFFTIQHAGRENFFHADFHIFYPYFSLREWVSACRCGLELKICVVFLSQCEWLAWVYTCVACMGLEFIWRGWEESASKACGSI